MVQTFFGCPLEPTAKFFGSIGIISSIIQTIGTISTLVIKRNISAAMRRRGLYITESEVKIFLIIFLVLRVFSGVASICLVLGTIKKRPNLILVWLISSALSILFAVVFMLHIYAFKSLLGTLLPLYFWIAMFSLYKKIKMENRTAPTPIHIEHMPKQVA